MGPVAVVLPSVVLGHDFGFQQRVKHLDCQQHVAEFAVEGFHERVLPWRSRLDEHRPGGAEAAPVGDRVARHLWTDLPPFSGPVSL